MGETTSIFSERLSDLVEKHKERTGMSQNQIAKELGISNGAFSNYMADCAEAKIKNLSKIASYFNVSADYMLGKVNDPTINIELQQFCKYTGLSEYSVNKLFGIKEALNEDGSFIINQIFCHEDYVKFLNAIQAYVQNFNRNQFNSDSENSKIIAGVIGCRQDNVKDYLEESIKSVIKSTIIEIVKDIK